MPPSGRRDALPRRPTTANTATTSSSSSLPAKNEVTERTLVSTTKAEPSENANDSLVGNSAKGCETGLAETFVIDGFVIEAYTCIGEVPYAECAPVPTPKSCENERADSLYGFCRTCLTNKPEPMLLCEHCDRAFHLTCLHPPLHEAPRGEWECARCVRQHRFHHHLRATNAQSAVRAANAIAAPVPHPRLRHKHLAITAPSPLSMPSPPQLLPALSTMSSRPPRKRVRMHLQQQFPTPAVPLPLSMEKSTLSSTMATVRAVRAAIDVARSNGMSVDDARLNAAAEAVRLLSTATVRRAVPGVQAREVRVGAEVTSYPLEKQPQSPHPLPLSLPDRSAISASPSKPRRGPGRPKGSVNKVRKARPGATTPPSGSAPISPVLPNGEGPPRPKRPRGRPPKAASLAAISTAITETNSAPRRGPGRPPKAPSAGNVVSSGTKSSSSTAPFLARRGRPPKNPTAVHAGPARGPGRPPKTASSITRGPERQPKAEGGPSRGPGRPRKAGRLLNNLQPQSHSPQVTSPTAPAVIKAPRGRPPKSPVERTLIKAPRGRPPKSRILQQHRKDQESMDQQALQGQERERQSKKDSKEEYLSSGSIDSRKQRDPNSQLDSRKSQQIRQQPQIQSSGLTSTTSKQELDEKQTQVKSDPCVPQLRQMHSTLPHKQLNPHPNHSQFHYQQQERWRAAEDTEQQHQNHYPQRSQAVQPPPQLQEGKGIRFTQPFETSHELQQPMRTWQPPLIAEPLFKTHAANPQRASAISTAPSQRSVPEHLVKPEARNAEPSDERMRPTLLPNQNPIKPESHFHPSQFSAQGRPPQYQEYGRPELMSNSESVSKSDSKVDQLKDFQFEKAPELKAHMVKQSSAQHQAQSGEFKQNSALVSGGEPNWRDQKPQPQHTKETQAMSVLPHHQPSPFTSQVQVHQHSLTGGVPHSSVIGSQLNRQQRPPQAYYQNPHPMSKAPQVIEGHPLSQYRFQAQNRIQHRQQMHQPKIQSSQTYHSHLQQTQYSSGQLLSQRELSCPSGQERQYHQLTQQQHFHHQEQFQYEQHQPFLRQRGSANQDHLYSGQFPEQFQEQFQGQRQKRMIPQPSPSVVGNGASISRPIPASVTTQCSPAVSVPPKAHSNMAPHLQASQSIQTTALSHNNPSGHQQSRSVSHLLNSHAGTVSQRAELPPHSIPGSSMSRMKDVRSPQRPYVTSHLNSHQNLVAGPSSCPTNKSSPSSGLQTPQYSASRLSRRVVQTAISTQAGSQLHQNESTVNSATTARLSQSNPNLRNRMPDIVPANGENNVQLLSQTIVQPVSSSARAGGSEDKSQSYTAPQAHGPSEVLSDSGVAGASIRNSAGVLDSSFPSDKKVSTKTQVEAPHSPSALGDDVPLSQLRKHRQIAQKHDSSNTRDTSEVTEKDMGIGKPLVSNSPRSGHQSPPHHFSQNVHSQSARNSHNRELMPSHPMIPPNSRSHLGTTALVSSVAPRATTSTAVNFKQSLPQTGVANRMYPSNQVAQASPSKKFTGHSSNRFSNGVNPPNVISEAPVCVANPVISHSSQIVNYPATAQVVTPTQPVEVPANVAQLVGQPEIASKDGFYSRTEGAAMQYAALSRQRVQEATEPVHVPEKQERILPIQAGLHDVQGQAQPYQLQSQGNTLFVAQQDNVHSRQQLVPAIMDDQHISSSSDRAVTPLHSGQMQIDATHQSPNQQMATEIGAHHMTPQQLAQAQLVQAQMAKKRRTPEQLAQAQLAHSHLTQAQIAKKRRTPQQLAQSQFHQSRILQVPIQAQGEQGHIPHRPLSTVVQPLDTAIAHQNTSYQAQTPFSKPEEEQARVGITVHRNTEDFHSPIPNQAAGGRVPHTQVYARSPQVEVDPPQSYHPMDPHSQPSFTSSIGNQAPLPQAAYIRSSTQQTEHPGQTPMVQSNGLQVGQVAQVHQVAAVPPSAALPVASAPAATVLGVRQVR